MGHYCRPWPTARTAIRVGPFCGLGAGANITGAVLAPVSPSASHVGHWKDRTVNKFIACIFVVSLGACASDEASRRETTTARTSADAEHRHHHRERLAGDPGDVDVDDKESVRNNVDQPTGVKPVAIANAPAPAHDADGRVDEEHVSGADQGKRPSDTEVTRRIRKAVTSDDKLTAATKNVRIVTQDGRVTLRGNVPNDREKTAVESHAREVAGSTNVDNQLVVP